MKQDQNQQAGTAADDRLLTRAEVEQRFGIPKRFLELAVARKEGPRLIRIGRLVRYRVSDLRTWLEAQVSDE